MRRNATLFVLISLLSGFGSTAMMLAAGIWVLDLTGSVGLAALTGVGVYAPTLSRRGSARWSTACPAARCWSGSTSPWGRRC